MRFIEDYIECMRHSKEVRSYIATTSLSFLSSRRIIDRLPEDPFTPLSPFFLFFPIPSSDPTPLASNSAQIERAKTIRSQASLHLAQEGKSKAEVASLLKHGVGASVGLMETKGYESYKREGERNTAIRA